MMMNVALYALAFFGCSHAYLTAEQQAKLQQAVSGSAKRMAVGRFSFGGLLHQRPHIYFQVIRTKEKMEADKDHHLKHLEFDAQTSLYRMKDGQMQKVISSEAKFAPKPGTPLFNALAKKEGFEPANPAPPTELPPKPHEPNEDGGFHWFDDLWKKLGIQNPILKFFFSAAIFSICGSIFFAIAWFSVSVLLKLLRGDNLGDLIAREEARIPLLNTKE